MADNGDAFGPALAIDSLPAPATEPEPGPEAPIRFPRRPRLRVDPTEVVTSVKARWHQIKDDRDRGDWMDARLQRYAKYRGWLEEKTFPWPGCANVHVPILQAAELRANAGLHNTILTLRPLISAKAVHPGDVTREEKITAVIDTELFVDPGPERAEQIWSDYVSAFLQDGLAMVYTPWVRDERTITTVHHAPPLEPGVDPEEAVAQFLQRQFGEDTPRVEETALGRYDVLVRERTGQVHRAHLAVYQEEDDGFAFELTEETILYDGPVALPLSIDRVFVPTRCDNLQPPTPWNPGGASYVIVEWPTTLDEIRRLKADRALNYLDAEGMDRIEAIAVGKSGGPETEDRPMQVQKDTLEGVTHEAPEVPETPVQGHLPVTTLLVFDRWDVDGDGLAEDVIWRIDPEADVLLDARRLREVYPSVRARRPFAMAACIPVPGRFYPISLLELGESMHDYIVGLLNQAHDAATIGNMPFFFYGASSKFTPDLIHLAPGEGYPVPGNPRDTVLFPNMPAKDQTWAIQFMGLAFQTFERVMMIGDLQLGRVPIGKASALRTYGTTAALLQQGDTRADQMLLRLFGGFRQIAENFHQMNRHRLPPGREVQRVGWDGEAEQGYLTVEPAEIDAEVRFEFRPDFLNSNPQVQAAALQEIMGMVITPIAFQGGITDMSRVYKLIRDFVKAKRLDPREYTKPPTPSGAVPILAEEAINQILAGRRPSGYPLEGFEEHVKKLGAFFQSDTFGLLDPTRVAIFMAYAQALQQAQQQQALQQAAQQFQQALQQQTGAGGVLSLMQTPGVGEGALAAPASPGGAQ